MTISVRFGTKTTEPSRLLWLRIPCGYANPKRDTPGFLNFPRTFYVLIVASVREVRKTWFQNNFLIYIKAFCWPKTKNAQKYDELIGKLVSKVPTQHRFRPLQACAHHTTQIISHGMNVKSAAFPIHDSGDFIGEPEKSSTQSIRYGRSLSVGRNNSGQKVLFHHTQLH